MFKNDRKCVRKHLCEIVLITAAAAPWAFKAHYLAVQWGLKSPTAETGMENAQFLFYWKLFVFNLLIKVCIRFITLRNVGC